MNVLNLHRKYTAIISGILLTLSFAPFDLYYLAFLAIALLKSALNNLQPKQAVNIGFLFGLSLFGSGTSWVYVSMMLGKQGFAFMPFIMALLFCSFWAIFLAVFSYLYTKCRIANKLDILFFSSLWVCLEYIRGEWILNGFPWLQLAYSQIDTPFSGYIPLFGVYGTSFIIVITSCLLLKLTYRFNKLNILLIGSIFFLGLGLANIKWVEPAGDAFKVTLIQGNIAQKDKWLLENKNKTLKQYYADTSKHLDSALVIWPETSIPAYYSEVKDGYLASLQELALSNETDIVTSLPYKNEKGELYNSVLILGQKTGLYKKIHLLPFGEYLPWQPISGYLLSLVDVRLGMFSSGKLEQTLLTGAGHKFVTSICYEDAFGQLSINQVKNAKFLVNLTNDGWFDGSIEPYQHMQIARMRALESGRFLLRATNTGMTAIVSEKGELIAQAPIRERASVTGMVTPMQGLTPYAKVGDKQVLWLILVLFLILLSYQRFSYWACGFFSCEHNKNTNQ